MTTARANTIGFVATPTPRQCFDIYTLMLRWSYRSDWLTNRRFDLIRPIVRDVIATDATLVWC